MCIVHKRPLICRFFFFDLSLQSISIEAQGRLFADLLFFLGDYAQATVAYRNVVTDFRHARATKQLGVIKPIQLPWHS